MSDPKPCVHDLLNCFECEYPDDKAAPAPADKWSEELIVVLPQAERAALRAELAQEKAAREKAEALATAACAMVDEHQGFLAQGWPQGSYTPAFSALRVAVAEYRLARQKEESRG